jgi:hypothetical protein
VLRLVYRHLTACARALTAHASPSLAFAHCNDPTWRKQGSFATLRNPLAAKLLPSVNVTLTKLGRPRVAASQDAAIRPVRQLIGDARMSARTRNNGYRKLAEFLATLPPKTLINMQLSSDNSFTVNRFRRNLLSAAEAMGPPVKLRT